MRGLPPLLADCSGLSPPPPATGDDTTVLFGFLSTLLNLLELVPPPTHFAVVFDARGKTFRCEAPWMAMRRQ